MPKRAPTPRFPFRTYQHLLAVLTQAAMTMVQRLPDDMVRDRNSASPSLDFSTLTRNFCVVSGLLRRSIVVSRYIATLPVPTEEREHRLGQAFERAFRQFATRKMTVEEYHRAVDAGLDGELEAEFEQPFLDGDEEEREYDPDADVPGRPSSALVAELCRDFGMIARTVPAEWLMPVPTDLRLLCARAAAAAIRPSRPPVHVGGLTRR